MRAFCKNLLIISSIYTIIFACSYAHAYSDSLHTHSGLNDSKPSYQVFLPHVANEREIILIARANQHSFRFNLPLLPEFKAENIKQKSCTSKKKNDLYELSAMINDKLQTLLAYFDVRKPYHIAEKSNSKDDLSVNNNISIQ